jgi:hypothetical protein
LALREQPADFFCCLTQHTGNGGTQTYKHTQKILKTKREWTFLSRELKPLYFMCDMHVRGRVGRIEMKTSPGNSTLRIIIYDFARRVFDAIKSYRRRRAVPINAL